MVTQILHISDTHLGKRQYRSDKRLSDYADAFEEAVELAIDLDVDAVLHTGDLFDAPNPNVPTVNRCLDIIKMLDDAGIPFLGIVGNHERKRDEQWLDLVDRFELVERLDKSPRYLGDGDDRVALYGIDAVRRPEWESTDFTLEQPEEHMYTLLAMHELLAPPVPGHMAHYETQDVLDRLGWHIDALALGDYHEPETVEVDGTKVWYPGSTEKTARDESEDHYVNLLDIEDGDLTIRKKRLDCPRPFVEFPIEFGDDDGLKHAEREVKKYDYSGDNGKNAVAVAILSGEQTGVTPKDVHRLLDKHGAAVTKVVDNRGLVDAEDIDVDGAEMSRMDDLIDEGVDDLDLSDTGRELETLVRDEGVQKTNIRDSGAAVLDDALNGGDDE